MKINEKIILMLIFATLTLSGCTSNNLPNNDINKPIVESNKIEIPNKIDNSTASKVYSKEQAVELIAKEYYNNSKENLFVDTNPEYQPNVYVVSEKIDSGSHLYTTVQSYLVKDGKVIDTLYDEKMNLNKNYWEHVKQYEKNKK